MSRSVWQISGDVDRFDTLSTSAQQDIINEVIEIRNTKYCSWHYHWLVYKLFPMLQKTNKEKAYQFVKDVVDENIDLGNSYFHQYLLIAISDQALKDSIIDLLKSTKNIKVKRFLLGLSGIGEDIEELGLRDLARLANTPTFIIERKYKPSYSVLEKLPPVMRLNILESLTANFNIGYNILENIPNLDECRRMLFGSVLRHRDRAENVVKRYIELSDIGNPKTFMVDIWCPICGTINIKVTTGRIKDENRLEKTKLMKIASKYWCPICGNNGIKRNITWED
jgi:hypothetical protein